MIYFPQGSRYQIMKKYLPLLAAILIIAGVVCIVKSRNDARERRAQQHAEAQRLTRQLDGYESRSKAPTPTPSVAQY